MMVHANWVRVSGKTIQHDWMYDRCTRGEGALKVTFLVGVNEFLKKACQ